jgi:hypothetical protein
MEWAGAAFQFSQFLFHIHGWDYKQPSRRGAQGITLSSSPDSVMKALGNPVGRSMNARAFLVTNSDAKYR